MAPTENPGMNAILNGNGCRALVAIRRLTAISFLTFAAACGTTSETVFTSAGEDSSPSTMPSDTAAPTPVPTPEGTPTEYSTSLFTPAFAVDLPPGWVVSERAADVAQIYQRCDSCPHGGEENGEITLDMSSGDMSVEDVIADLQEAVGMDPAEVTAIEVGELTGMHFVATRSETTDVAFQTSGYHSEPFGLPIDVYALTLGDQTATLFIDPHEAQGTEGEAFMTAAHQILASLRTLEPD
jgi:hypothetical protein